MKKEVVVIGVGAISLRPLKFQSEIPLKFPRHHIQQPNLRQRLASAILPVRQSVTKRAACQVNLYQLSVCVYLLDNEGYIRISNWRRKTEVS